MQDQQQIDIVSDLLNRVRAVESKYALLGEQILVINENMLVSYNDLAREIKVINSELKEIRQDVFNLKETMKHLIQETEMFARKDQLKVLEKYINLWNPMEFVTTDELNKALAEKLKTGGTTAKKRKY